MHRCSRLLAWPLLPTHELHRSATAVFTGPHAGSRAALDYSWHSHYTPTRQAVQDSIISSFLEGGCVTERPWLCLTAGVMGAGKSRTIRWLNTNGYFPFHRFVLVEADRIKSMLPEMARYVRENRRLAGTLLHRESCYIAEVLEREALGLGKNVLVDSSLRDGAWYEGVFKHLRMARPNYRIAILMVTASRETIYERVARRAAVTGRDVPREVLNDAITRVPLSFARLAPLADYAAIIRNDGDDEPPVLDETVTLPGQVGAAASAAPQLGHSSPWDDLQRLFNDNGTCCSAAVDEVALRATLQGLLERSHGPSSSSSSGSDR